MLKPEQYEILAPCVPSSGAIILPPAIILLVADDPLLHVSRTGFINLGSIKEQNYNNLRVFSFSNAITILFIYSVLGGRGAGAHMLQQLPEVRGQFASWGRLSLSTTWVLGMELGSLGLTARAFAN